MAGQHLESLIIVFEHCIDNAPSCCHYLWTTTSPSLWQSSALRSESEAPVSGKITLCFCLNLNVCQLWTFLINHDFCDSNKNHPASRNHDIRWSIQVEEGGKADTSICPIWEIAICTQNRSVPLLGDNTTGHSCCQINWSVSRPFGGTWQVKKTQHIWVSWAWTGKGTRTLSNGMIQSLKCCLIQSIKSTNSMGLIESV